MEEERVFVRQEIHGIQNPTSVHGNATVIVHQYPPIPSVLPKRLWMVPYRRNGFFTGRETLLTALHTSFTKNRTAVLTQGQAINGLGGIGKTQVAVEYAYQYQREYQFILWASAATHETLIAAFVSIADGLQLPERTLQEQDKIVAAVQRWLSTNEGWLLIVDNADELGMAWPLLPTGSTGHVLVTTRSQEVADMESFLVEEMDRIEGTLLLLRRAYILKPGMELEQVSPSDCQIAEQIVTEMDGLPLALDQAGAYIKETPCSLSDYLSLYRTQRAKMLKERGSRINDYPETVATTWSISFQEVEQKSPAATELFQFCAFLAPDAIPEEIITTGAEHLGPLLQATARDPIALNKAIATLGAYSLIRRGVTEKMLSIHRLVQAILRDAMPAKEKKLWAERTVRAVNATFSDVEFAQWLQCERCLPHAQACADLIDLENLMLPEAASLLNTTGCYLRERASYSEAEPLHVRALSINEKALGLSHPHTALSLTSLALLYKNQGKYEQAEPLYQRTLAICERQLGPDHPQTALSLNNLAELYRAAGKYKQVEPLHQCALAIYERQLGPDHPFTASSLNNLALLYDNQGKYKQAEPLYQRALAIREQQLGPDHPDTALSLSNLALLYNNQGKHKQTEPLYQRTLAICEQQLGPDHPQTAQSLNNLAALYEHQGKYEQAEPLFRRALAIQEKQLGPDHPHTAQSLNNLATLYEHQGKYEQAEPLHQRALAICERQLGPDHPHTAQSLNNLAMLYCKQHKYEQAEPLFRRTLAIQEKQLGPDHPHTAQSLNNLAGLYYTQGKYKQAEPLFRRTLAIQEKQLGPDHSHTARSLNNLATLYEHQGKYKQAEPLFRRALAIQEKQLGPDHPHTAISLNNLATLHHSHGKYEQAEPLYLRSLNILEQSLGSQHHTTLSVRKYYVILLRAMGRDTEAMQIEEK